MKRFNQAWLLDPMNPQAYFGFGVIVSKRGRTQQGIALFEKALALAPDDPAIMSDLAHSYSLAGSRYLADRNLIDQGHLEKAEALFTKASTLAKEKPAIHANWAVNRFYRGDLAGAWEKIGRARELGGEKEIDQEFLKALRKRMPDPQARP